MKQLNFIFAFVIAVHFLSAQTKIKDHADAYEQLKALITEGHFEFVAIRASPRSGGSIDLAVQTNYLRIAQDSVTCHMPFFGVRYSGGGYDTAGPISFMGKMLDYNVKYRDRKHRISITFYTLGTSERIDAHLSVGSSGWASLILRSVHRSSMGYYGRVQASSLLNK